MVMEYLNSSGLLTTPLPSFTLREIARIVRTQDGTLPTDVPLMNPRIEEAIPSVEFEDGMRDRLIGEIVEENNNFRPCIPWMFLTDGVSWTNHAVVVTDISRASNQITYNDPGPPGGRETTQPLSAFETVWGRAYTTLVKIQIGKKTRTVLTQFGEKK